MSVLSRKRAHDRAAPVPMHEERIDIFVASINDDSLEKAKQEQFFADWLAIKVELKHARARYDHRWFVARRVGDI